MRLRIQHTWAPKQGESASDYEDSFDHTCLQNGTLMRAAIADGATEAAYSKIWAQKLVENFTACPPREDLAAWLETPQKEWHEAVPWSRLPWHGLAKTKSGSHATLLGITIHCQADSDTAQWQAVSVGDCCAFITGKQHSLLRAFPTDDPDEFGNRPSLICSNPGRNGPAEMKVTRHHGLLHTGERIILATDAAAQWLLKTNQDGQTPWQGIAELTQDGMEEWVKSRRQDHGMKNDDVTITVIDAEHEEPEG